MLLFLLLDQSLSGLSVHNEVCCNQSLNILSELVKRNVSK